MLIIVLTLCDEGICDGLGMSPSSKAALVRQGLCEMSEYCQYYSELTAADSHRVFERDTLFKSCGVADLIVTCYSGRNRRCADKFARHRLEHGEQSVCCSARSLQELWDQIEAEELAGQKLQGVETCREIIASLAVPGGCLKSNPSRFPLLRRIHSIVCCGAPVDSLFQWENAQV